MGEKIKQEHRGENPPIGATSPAGISWCGARGRGGESPGTAAICAEDPEGGRNWKKRLGVFFLRIENGPYASSPQSPDISLINEVKHLNHFLFYSPLCLFELIMGK